jgi:DNA-binding HxlR family transcriptional regulator
MAVGPKCPVEVTVDVTGGKWKPMIIYRLLDGPYRFGELRRLVGDPSQRSLTMQLRELEADGIVSREVFAEVLRASNIPSPNSEKRWPPC